MHSIYSDGLDTVSDLLDKAKQKGLDIIALTDHDTFGGVSEAIKEGENRCIRVIKGSEISSHYYSHPVHILTYFKDEIPEAVLSFIDDMHQKRRKRALDMAHKLEDIFGLKLNIPELEQFEGNLTRGNLYRSILKYNDIKDTKENFDYYLGNNSKAYIKSTELSPLQIITFFRQFKCLIVIAHPTLYKEEVIEHVLNLDIDGIEAIYPRYETYNQDYFVKFAREHNLLITAGSDHHGKIDTRHAELAAVTLEGSDLDKFLERLEAL